MIQATGARKCFGDIVAVDGITAEIQTGSVYGPHRHQRRR